MSPYTSSPGLHLVGKVIVPGLAVPVVISAGLIPLVKHLGLRSRIPFDSDASFLAALVAGTMVSRTILERLWKALLAWTDRTSLGAIPVPKVRRGLLPGNVSLVLDLARKYPTEYPGVPLLELKDEYGPIYNLNVLWEGMIWSDHPSFIKEILVTDFNNYVKGENIQNALHSMLGTGIFNSDGEVWKFHRAMTRPFFTRDRITDFEIFDRHCEAALRRIQERYNDCQPIDFQDVISRFTMDSAAEFLFDASIHSLEAPLPQPRASPETLSETNRFTAAFQISLEAISKRLRWRASGWQLMEFWKDKTTESMKVIFGFIDPIVERALQEKAALKQRDSQATVDTGSGAGEAKETLLAHLVSVTDDKQLIRDELLNILLAGRDTTASLLTYVVYMLALDPRVLARLREEVLDVVGPTARPTFDHIRDMRYLRAVINGTLPFLWGSLIAVTHLNLLETLRLFPPVPFNMKMSVRSSVWTNPDTGIRYYIPAKTTILWSVLTTQCDPKLWGPDSHEFDPDRWLDDRKAYFVRNSFIFVPFQAGPRICVGQQFAYNESSFFLIRFLQKFDTVELAPDGQPKECIPPAEWKASPHYRKSVEHFMPKSHLTLYAQGAFGRLAG